MSKNLDLYESLRAVPSEAQKSFNNGRFSGTDINPMWRIKKMTEVFGPCGIGWYYEVVHRSLEHSSDGSTICAFIGLNLYIKKDGEWSKPIYGEGGNTMCAVNKKWQSVDTSDEAYKMALTDAFSNATKQLGLGADVWFEADKVHSTKYDLQTERKNAADKQPDAKPAPSAAPKPAESAPAKAPAPKTADEKKIFACKSKADLRELMTANNWWANEQLTQYATAVAKTLPEHEETETTK